MRVACTSFWKSQEILQHFCEDPLVSDLASLNISEVVVVVELRNVKFATSLATVYAHLAEVLDELRFSGGSGP